MKRKKLAMGIVIILLLGAAAGVFAAAQVAAPWQQVNSSGFGDALNDEVSALAAFDGFLYAGTHNATDPLILIDGAQIFRSPDGEAWTAVTQPGFGNPHDTAPPAILDLTVFDGYLYASTGRGDDAGKIFRTLDGTNWAPVVNSGFADPDTVEIGVLAEFGGKLYAGAKNLVNGAQIWSSFTGDSNSWTQVAPATPGTVTAGVTGMAVFDGGLYAAIESEDPAQIWRTFGSDWEVVVGDGFGDPDTTLTGGLAAFGGSLYAGAGNTGTGAQLFRTADGETWEPAVTPGSADTNNEKVEMLFVFQEQLYAGLRNTNSGIEIWRTADGAVWEQVNVDGFGDGNNTTTNWSNATADFLGHLYVGTANVTDGGELWRMNTALVCGITQDTPYDLAGLKVTITDVGTNLDCVAVTRVPNDHPSATTGIQTGQYWIIDGLQSDESTAAAPDFTFDITLPHAVDPHTNAKVCKYPGNLGGAGWDCDRTDSNATTVWRNGIAGGFSDWAVGDNVGPTALALTSFAVSSPARPAGLILILFGAFAVCATAWKLWSSRKLD